MSRSSEPIDVAIRGLEVSTNLLGMFLSGEMAEHPELEINASEDYRRLVKALNKLKKDRANEKTA